MLSGEWWGIPARCYPGRTGPKNNIEGFYMASCGSAVWEVSGRWNMPTWPPLTLGQSLDLEEISSQELDSPVFSLSLKGSSGLLLVRALERQGSHSSCV